MRLYKFHTFIISSFMMIYSVAGFSSVDGLDNRNPFEHLIINLKMDDITNDITPDASGNNHHGMISGVLSVQPGVKDQAVLFGESGGVISVDMEGWQPDEFTVSFWLKPLSVSNYNQQIGAGWDQFTIHTNKAGSYFVGTSTTDRITPGLFPSSARLKLDDWNHITITHRTDNLMSVYVNGILEIEKTVSPPQPWKVFSVGHVNQDKTIDGLVDELNVYSIALSESDVSKLYTLENQAPTVIASDDQTVHSNATVTLSATATGDGITYLWQQLSGPQVNLTNHDFSRAQFIAPVVIKPTQAEFSITVTDGQKQTATDSVNVRIEVLHNEAIMAHPERYSVPENRLMSVNHRGVLSNDIVPEESHPVAVLGQKPQHGLLNLSPQGSFTYMPNVSFTGQDHFTYRAMVDGFQSQEITVNLNVMPDNGFYPQILSPYVNPDSGLVHPGILINYDELKALGAALLEDDPIRNRYWTNMTNSGRGRIDKDNWKLTSNELYGTEWSSAMKYSGAGAIRYVLNWIMERDPKAEKNVITILNSWTAVTEFVPDEADVLQHHRLSGGIWLGYLAYAAELLIHSDTSWPLAEQEAFKATLRDVLLPIINGGFGDRASNFNGNWDLAATWSILATAVLLDDRALFDENIELLRSGESNARLSYYLLPTGQNAESGRDQTHSSMGAYFASLCAQIAWSQGIDLYEYNGRSEGKMFEHLALYNLGEDAVAFQFYPNPRHPSTSGTITTESTEMSDISRPFLPDIYEMIFHHYKTYRNTELPQSRTVLEETTRPEGAWSNGSNWGSAIYWNLDLSMEAPIYTQVSTADISVPLKTELDNWLILLNSGLSKNDDNYQLYRDNNKGVYVADYKPALTGKRVRSEVTEIANTEADYLYASWRESNNSSDDIIYQFKLANGNYKLHLHFAEREMEQVGARVFNIKIEDSYATVNLDVFSTVGKDAALIQEYSVTVQDERLDIVIEKVIGNPQISAIELLELAP